MARTRRRFTAPEIQNEEPLVSAAYQLAPRPRGRQNDFELKREVDIMLNGDANHNTDLAWYFYSRIPELRYISRYVANSLSQARLFVGSVTADPYNPERVGPRHQANAVLESFAGGFEGQSELLDRLGLHLTITGDSVLAGPTNADRPGKAPFDRYRIYSTNEIYSRNGVLYYRRPGISKDEQLPAGVTAVRVWRPHPRRWELADSPTLSAFTVLREIDLLDQHVHASAVSRLAGAGVWMLADEITFPADETETEGEDVDPFIKHLTEVMSIAIKNRESAAARVPVIIRGPADAINASKWQTFETPFSEAVPDLRNVALRRLALGMDVPPEVLLGMSESTQWSAWQTDESTVRLHTVPLLQLIVNSLTVGWFRPALKAARTNLSDKDIDRLTIWFDISNLRVRPSVTEESQALYDRFEVGGDTLRITTGFTDAEKPDKKELEEQILFHLLRENQNMAPYAINALREKGLIDLPEAPDPLTQPVANTGAPGPNPGSDIVDIQPSNGLPGQRSQDRQSSPPPTPSAEGDDSNNEVGRP